MRYYISDVVNADASTTYRSSWR